MQKVLQVGRKQGNEVTVTVTLLFFLTQGVLVTHYVRGEQLETQLDCCFYFYVIHTWLIVS